LLLSLNISSLKAGVILDYSFYSLVRMVEIRSSSELTTTRSVMLLKDYKPGVSNGLIDFNAFYRFFYAS
jgi:hypothetical protein